MDKQAPHFCEQVRSEVVALTNRVEDIYTNVIILINREKPPCVDYNKRITSLEMTKVSMSGGWKLFGILFGMAVGLVSTVAGIVILIERFK